MVSVRALCRSAVAAAFLSAISLAAALAGDIQVNSVDSNSPNLGNFTSESETFVARSGTLVVVGYNTSRQAGLLGAGAWNSLSGYAYSTNNGASFTDAGFVPNGPAGSSFVLEGDPALGFDRSGNLYYASLLENIATGGSFIGVSKSSSTSPTVIFGNPVAISGPSSTTGGFEDKELLAVDDTGGTFDGRVYVAWSDFPPTGNPQVMFAASTSTSPLAFGPTLQLAPLSSAFQHGAIPAVAPDGSVYVAWAQLSSFTQAASATVNLVKSTNGGATFSNPDPGDRNLSKTVASFTSTTGDIGSGGMSVRTRSFPYLAIDRTPAGSPTRGNIYVVFQAQPNSSAPPRSEILFTSSTDGGVHWSVPRNITSGPAATIGGDTTNNDNWLPSISVSPVTGHIKVLFYSRREDPANQNIRVYEAGSTDAGMTWYNHPYATGSFKPSDGYDPLLVRNYMGDYLNGDSTAANLLTAWGDTRNKCTPPAGATVPCTPAGRGDQDVWSLVEADLTGVDLAITPWGFVTGVGPTWQSPDIFVVNGHGVQVNAEKGVHNALRARIRNLGNANATNAVVRFRFAPAYGSLPDSIFKQIGTATVNVAAGTTQVVPIDWDLTNLNDTNGGIWPQPISAYDHFCVKVDIEYPSDINLSNNAAQSNFFNVSTGRAAVLVEHILVGNPLTHLAGVKLVVPPLPKSLQGKINPPVITLAPGAPTATTATPHRAGELIFRPNEVRTASITLTLPPASVRERLTEDIIVDVNSEVDGKIVSGLSFLLAAANIRTPGPVPHGPSPVVSKEVSTVPPPAPVIMRTFRLTAPVSREAAQEVVLRYLTARRIPIVQNNHASGVISSGPIPLTHDALLAAVVPQARSLIANDVGGRYYVSVSVTPAVPAGAQPKSTVQVSARILQNAAGLDSPLGGRLVPSNGRIEQSLLDGLSTQLHVR